MHIHFLNWMSFIKAFKDCSENITGRVEAFWFSLVKSGCHLRGLTESGHIWTSFFKEHHYMCSITLFEVLLLFGGDQNCCAAAPHMFGEIWVRPWRMAKSGHPTFKSLLPKYCFLNGPLPLKYLIFVSKMFMLIVNYLANSCKKCLVDNILLNRKVPLFPKVSLEGSQALLSCV